MIIRIVDTAKKLDFAHTFSIDRPLYQETKTGLVFCNIFFFLRVNTFSAGILATHSLRGFSVLGVGGRLSRSRDWLFLSIYTVRQFIRSLSLATLHLLSIEPVTFPKHEYSPPAHPPSFRYVPSVRSRLSIA